MVWPSPSTISPTAPEESCRPFFRLDNDITDCYHDIVRRKHRRTLAAIFETPTRSGIRWEDIESLLLALGAELEERAGSRVTFHLDGSVGHFHRPHPQPDVTKVTVGSIRRFLGKAGIENVDL